MYTLYTCIPCFPRNTTKQKSMHTVKYQRNQLPFVFIVFKSYNSGFVVLTSTSFYIIIIIIIVITRLLQCLTPIKGPFSLSFENRFSYLLLFRVIGKENDHFYHHFDYPYIFFSLFPLSLGAKLLKGKLSWTAGGQMLVFMGTCLPVFYYCYFVFLPPVHASRVYLELM